MIPAREMKEKARGLGVPESTIERDYAQNWLLKHLSNLNMALKGGTGIRKAYIRDYRFSDDLDFTLLEEMDKHKLESLIKKVVSEAKEESGINFADEMQIEENENGFEVTVHFRILRTTGSPIRIKLDITSPEKEKILSPIEKRPVIYPYSDKFNVSVAVYSLEEIFVEKIRAFFERTRPRDLYDIWFLKDHTKKSEVIKILNEKCSIKGIKIDISLLEERREDFGNAWDRSLRHQVKILPDFKKVYDEVIKEVTHYEPH